MAGGMGLIGTVVGIVIGWYVSSNFIAPIASQVVGSISGAAGGLLHRGYDE